MSADFTSLEPVPLHIYNLINFQKEKKIESIEKFTGAKFWHKLSKTATF